LRMTCTLPSTVVTVSLLPEAIVRSCLNLYQSLRMSAAVKVAEAGAACSR